MTFEQFQNIAKLVVMEMAINAQENDNEEETTEEDE